MVGCIHIIMSGVRCSPLHSNPKKEHEKYGKQTKEEHHWYMVAEREI